MPFSEEACRSVANRMGLKYSEGHWPTKGCYAYTNGKYPDDIFYGTGGTDDENRSFLDPAEKKRPSGFDCKTGLMIIIIYMST